MGRKKTESDKFSDLRERAEKTLQAKPIDLDALSSEDVRRLVHELEVHQIELEMQNEELRRAQRELEAAREKYFDLYDLAPVGYLTISEQGLILEANLTAANLLGVERGHLVEHPLSRFIVSEDQDTYYFHRKQLFEAQAPQVCELRMTRPDGSRFWARIEAAVAKDNEGQTVYREMISNTTDRKQMEEQLQQQGRLAAIGQLAGGIAHDFNNLLTSIILNAQIQLDKPHLPPDIAPGIEGILDESRRAAQLVQQILDFSRRAMIKPLPVDLASFIEKSVDILQRTLPENIRLTLETGSEEYVIKADPARIQQAVMNLATNARDAMPEGGELRISLSRIEIEPGKKPPMAEMPPGGWVCLAVSDTGTGMTARVQDHLFEPFFTTKPVGEGTGLGLAQVHGIVKQHGGYIGVKTESGKGTTFYICLPVHEGEVEKAKGIAPPPLGKGETILLVEDDERIRKVGQSVLESLGYRAVTAADGLEALEAYRLAGTVDLVITDMMMPEVGGRQLLQELKMVNSEAKVLAITGYAMQVDLETMKEEGFVSVIRKPFDVDTLAQAVRQALDGG